MKFFCCLDKIGNLAVRVSEKIDKDLFTSILKASKKMKKKRGKKKKKVLYCFKKNKIYLNLCYFLEILKYLKCPQSNKDYIFLFYDSILIKSFCKIY